MTTAGHGGARARTGALALAVSLLVVLVTAGRAYGLTAGDLGYPYPNAPDCNEQTGANCAGDQWGFVQGQCHSWVAYRLNELNALELGGATFDNTYRQPAGQRWGNPPTWDAAAARAGIVIDDVPALGSVAWWKSNGGHVAYVEGVNADGTVSISEMNADYHNGFDEATLQRGQRWPDGFIHIGDRTSASSATVPSAPTGVTASAGDGTAHVQWDAPGNDGGSSILTYRVTVHPGGQSVLVNAPSTSTTMTGLVDGTSYTFTVHATNAVGPSIESGASNAVVPVGPPASPSGVTASASLSSVVVSWSAASDNGSAITDYTLAVHRVGGATTYLSAGPTTTTTLTGLVPGGSYKFLVAATNALGSSPYSPSSAAVTVPLPPPPPPPVVNHPKPRAARPGYWMLTSAGRVYAFGSASNKGGPAASLGAGDHAVQVVPSWKSGGYYVVTGAGHVYAFGDAPHLRVPALHLVAGEHIVSMSLGSAPARGAWLFSSRGRVVAIGGARSLGDLARLSLHAPVLQSVATPSGRGYYMVASDGGVFTFGDAKFRGSMGATPLRAPVVALVPTASGRGYWLVASDGGVFAFGDARFRGSMGGTVLRQPIAGMVRYGNGYLMVAADGGVFAFSNLAFVGSLGAQPPASPVVSIAVPSP